MLTTRCIVDNCHVSCISIGKIQWKKVTAENWTQQMNHHQLTRLGSLSCLPMCGALKRPGGRGWLLIGKLWSEAASWITSSISTIYWDGFSLPNTFRVTGIVDDFWKQTMAQDMAKWWWSQKLIVKKTLSPLSRVAYASGRTKDSYRRTRRSVCQEHVGSCSGWPQARVRETMRMSPHWQRSGT